ncbi:hypothetical protein SDC9_162874 [bioreactor metagenome]|uniref:Uncharacterized protein n=1 Tax=bioreactor metagenome TaxID=1076179 RepID=A0A645FNM1_9ZZZZ
MNKYRVCGHTTVTVTIEVMADSEDEAYDIAKNELCSLTPYGGNGGTNKLVGVDGDNEDVDADEDIEYDDIEVIETDCEEE